jgi:A/G-specific adenine glycosylase
MVDGNVVHLVNRVFGSNFKGAADSRAWEFMKRFGGKKQDKRLYWGIIDLVATTCLRRFPRCGQCPLNNLCEYHGRNVKEDGTT